MELLPGVADIRRRISAVDDEGFRSSLMATYLFAARVSEVVAYAEPGDISTTARGPRGTDVRIDSVDGEDVAVFRIATAKRRGRERYCALPLKYEPWAVDLVDYYDKRKDGWAFPYNRQKIWRVAREAFDGYQYAIESYKLHDGELIKTVEPHPRRFAVHALRHLRASELAEYYGFDPMMLSVYCGWTMKAMIGAGMLDRYLSINWRYYLPKLLKRRMD